MKNLLLFFFFLITITGFSQTDSLVNSETLERIYWSDWYRLEWSDFQGDPEHGMSIAAVSNISLPYDLLSDEEGELIITLNVCFLKKESWSKEEKQNKVLLQHEQLHFDVAELHRRKLMKAISEAEFDKDNYKDVLENIIHENWTIGYREMQDKYDKETNYSRNFRGQINWNKFVSQQLRNLDEFKFNKISVSLITFD